MTEPTRIEIRKVLFAVASPQIVVAPSALRKNRRLLALKPELKDFVLDIIIKENLTVRYAEWAKPLQGAINALAALPKVDSLAVNVTFETKIRSVGDDDSKTIPKECITMINECFRRLRGVAHADVSGLGADGGDDALAAHLTAAKTAVKKAKNEKASKKRVSGEEEAEVSEADEGKSDRQTKRARR